MKRILTTMLICTSFHAQAVDETWPAFDWYAGLDYTAVKLDEWGIEDGAAGAISLKLGWEPTTWLGFEGRYSLLSGDDNFIKYDLQTSLSNVGGMYFKLKYPLNNVSPYLIAGRTVASLELKVPDYSESDIYQEFLELLFPNDKVPDELKDLGPGKYSVDINENAVGLGVDWTAPSGQWRMNFEYMELIDRKEWDWSVWSVGFSYNF